MKNVYFLIFLGLISALPAYSKVKVSEDRLTKTVTATNPVGSQSFFGTKIPEIKSSIEVASKGNEINKIAFVFMMNDHAVDAEMGEGDLLIGENEFSSQLKRTKLEDAKGMNIANAIAGSRNAKKLIKEYYEAIITREDLMNIINSIESKKEILFRIVLKDQRQVDLKFKKAQPFKEILSYIDGLNQVMV